MIKENVSAILNELPCNVKLVAAAKMRTSQEVMEAVDAGVKILGENYIQEAEKMFKVIGNEIKWHFIGHLQKNKVKKAIKIFDLIETVDSLTIAAEIDKRCAQNNKIMSVLVEINSGEEEQKFGLLPKEAEDFIKEVSILKNIKILGLMTMGPQLGDSEDARPYFIKTRKVFERIKKLNLLNVEMKYLSMGMTNSYKVAIEEGANIVRIGTKIFGERE